MKWTNLTVITQKAYLYKVWQLGGDQALKLFFAQSVLRVIFRCVSLELGDEHVNGRFHDFGSGIVRWLENFKKVIDRLVFRNEDSDPFTYNHHAPNPYDLELFNRMSKLLFPYTVKVDEDQEHVIAIYCHCMEKSSGCSSHFLLDAKKMKNRVSK